MTSTITPSTSRASFAIGNEQTARRVVDRLNESFFEGQAAIAAFERSDGRWDVTMHFAEAPDQTSIRELVGIAAGGDIALFAHGHVLRVLVARWIGLPAGCGQHFLLDTGTLCVLGDYRGIPAVQIWNGPLID